MRRFLIVLAFFGVLVPVLAQGVSTHGTAHAAPSPSPKEVANAVPASAKADLQARLGALMRKAPKSSGAWVYDVTGADPLFDRAASRPLIPASNMKILTTAAAFSRLGGLSHLKTSIWAVGSISGTTLTGDLFLVGDGDPALSTSAFAQRRTHRLSTSLTPLADDVRAAGIRRVTGRLYADDTVFDRVRGVVDSGGRTSSYIGPLSGLDFDSGYTATGRRFATDPAIVAGVRMIGELKSRGVRVIGAPKLKRLPGAPSGRVQIGAVSSPEMSKLIRETNVYSNNHWAEMLLKQLGAKIRGTGSTAAGIGVVRDFLASIGVAGFKQVDGSGLSRPNRATPAAIGALLRRMNADPDHALFEGSLPLAGSEGTLRRRMHGTAAAGHCRAKTGTLRDVSALSGYCFHGGRTLVFSIVMNGVSSTGAAQAIQDKMVAAIAAY